MQLDIRTPHDGAAPRCAAPDRIARPRLERRLHGREARPVVVLVGPAGAGKSELLRPLRDDPEVLFFRAGNDHATFARLVYGLANTVARVAPGAQSSFPRAWERALQSRSAGTVLAHWLCEHLADSDRHIVIDDLHDAAIDPSIAAFVDKLAELRPDARLTIGLRAIGNLPVALWMARGRMERPIDADDLRFDRAEVAAAARGLEVPLTDPQVDALLTGTRGSAVAVSYALNRLRSDGQAGMRTAIAASFEDIARDVFARRSERERAYLFGASMYPGIDDDLLRHTGWDDAASIRHGIGSDGDFLWEADAAGGLRFHDRFRDFLLRELGDHEAFRSTVARQTVTTLRAAGRFGAALALATQQRLTSAVGELLEEHGFTMLESGSIGVISEALGALDTPAHELGARTIALRGYLDARSDRLDTAEAWFRLGLDKAPDVASRAAIAMYFARELTLRRRPDACDVLEAFADSAAMPSELLIDVRSAFAQALTAANRIDEAVARTDAVVAMLADDSPAALRARVYARAAYVAIETGSLALARERALIAAPLAVSESLYDVAASAYSVLHNIAYDIDDDVDASLEYLRNLRALAVKSGTLRLDLYALLGMYGLYAESGDEAALAELDRDVAAADKHEATSEVLEGLLAPRALQAAWAGRFDEAQRLVLPAAERQATPIQRAFCRAQFAVYLAATDRFDEARDAMRTAAAELGSDDVGTTQHCLTILMLGLAAWTAGDAAGATDYVARADCATRGGAPRLQALRAAVEALVAAASGSEASVEAIVAALEALRAVRFGGMARLIEALPDRMSIGGSAPGSIGAALALREIPERFAGAVASGDAAPLYRWLDRAPNPIVAPGRLAELYAGWAARAAERGQAPGAAARIAAQIDAYRRPAPAIVRLVDDVDATIDVLFEHLDAAAPLMAEHSRAVSAWCSRIARAFGLTEDEIVFVTRGGLIHDVGKMRTPAQILHAPRALDDREWAIMRDHAAVGGRIVAEHALLRPFVPIVRGHHERLDGKGYPDGLRTTAIPFAARVVAVADSFNAMIGRRPYRLPMAPTQALEELQRNRGTQFDPEIVEAMVGIVLGRVAVPSSGP